jgi:N-succinyldiaminopimelate aminotransferase
VAWVTAAPELVTAVRTAKQFLTYVASGPFQYAVAEALALPDTYYTGVRDDLAAKRDLLTAGLTTAGFDVHRPQGTYFITTDIAELAPGIDALTFCRALPERCGVVAVPNSVFYDHPTAGRTQVRFAFCKRHDVLREAAERLRKAFSA